MDTSKNHKRVACSILGAVAAAAIPVLIVEIRKALVRRAEFLRRDRKLNRALVASMDCSDPVAKY